MLHAACEACVVRCIGPNLPGRATLRFEAHGRDRRALLVLHSNPIRFVALRFVLLVPLRTASILRDTPVGFRRVSAALAGGWQGTFWVL
jgi:hypothetical protein